MSNVPYLRAALGISGVSPVVGAAGSFDLSRWDDPHYGPIDYLLAAQPSLGLSDSQLQDFNRLNRHFHAAGVELEGEERRHIQQAVLNQIFRRMTLEQRAEARLVLQGVLHTNPGAQSRKVSP